MNCTHDFEQTVTWLTKHMSMSAVGEYMRTQYRTVSNIVKRVYDSMVNKNRFDNLQRIGIDETSYKVGHIYMVTVINHDTGKIIWAGKDCGEDTLRKFFEELTPEQRESIKYITADSAQYIAKLAKEYCPKAKRCVDRFHVVKWATEALDEVRRDLWRDAHKAAKRKNASSETKAKAKAIKNTRYAVLKNPEHLTESQLATLELQVKSNPKYYHAYLLKEKLRLAFSHSVDEAENQIDEFIFQATKSDMPEFVALAERIERHKEAILDTIRYGLSNGRVEAINNNIKRTIRIGYGFHSFESLISVVLIRSGDVSVTLPRR